MTMPKSVGKALESAIKDKEDRRETVQKRGGKTFSNKNRRDIYSSLTLAPGMGATEISHRTLIKTNTVIWHLDRLKSAGYVVERGVGGKRVFLPEGLVPAEDIALFALLNRHQTGLLLSLALGNPGCSQSDLSRSSEMGHQSVSKIMKSLESAGIISIVTEGNHVRYYPTKALSEKAENYYPKSKRFGEFLIKRMKVIEKENPKIIKKSLDKMIIEFGPKNARTAMEVGLNPYLTIV